MSTPRPNAREILSPVIEDVVARTREARDRTTREVAAIRDAIERVVRMARAELDDARIAVGGGEDDRAAALLRRLEEVDAITSAHLERVEAISHRIAEVARCAVDQCERMVKCSQDVKRLARRSRVLSLNTVVSASHLGALGAPISVVATEMTRIHGRVDEFAREVDRRAAALARVLPTLAGIAEALDTTTREHSERLHRQAEQGNALRRDIAATLAEISASLERRMQSVLHATTEILEHLAFTGEFMSLLDAVDDQAASLEAALEDTTRLAG